MIRFFLTAALGVVCVSGFAQGTLDFSNGDGLAYPAKVYNFDGVTPVVNTNQGTRYVADLYWAPGITDSNGLWPLNAPAPFTSDPNQAGLFFGGPRTVPAAPGSTITAQVRVWDTNSGASWFEASFPGGTIGESILFTVTLSDPTNAPTPMSNLNGHPWTLLLVPVPHDTLIGFQDVGVRSNQFGFTIIPLTWIRTLVVEATTDLSIWTPVQTNDFITVPFYFSDPQWTNYPTRIYRFPSHN